MKKNSAGIFIAFIVISESINAQLDLTQFQISVNGGILVYQGDLTPSAIGSYRTMKQVWEIYVSKTLTPVFALRTNLAFGKLSGDDAKYSSPSWRQQRNFNFSSPVFEITQLLVWNPLGVNGTERIKNFSPYLFGGAGISFLNIKRDWSKLNTTHFSSADAVNTSLGKDLQHRMPRILPVAPVGAGLSYPISLRISLQAETLYRFTITDYLDGFSKSANPKLRDHYFSHTLGIVYYFGRRDKLNCPVLKN